MHDEVLPVFANFLVGCCVLRSVQSMSYLPYCIVMRWKRPLCCKLGKQASSHPVDKLPVSHTLCEDRFLWQLVFKRMNLTQVLKSAWKWRYNPMQSVLFCHADDDRLENGEVCKNVGVFTTREQWIHRIFVTDTGAGCRLIHAYLEYNSNQNNLLFVYGNHRFESAFQ